MTGVEAAGAQRGDKVAKQHQDSLAEPLNRVEQNVLSVVIHGCVLLTTVSPHCHSDVMDMVQVMVARSGNTTIQSERFATMISLRRFFGHSLAALGLCIAAGGVAQATPLTSGSFQILSTDPTQLGRLSRDGIPSYWGDPTLPSVINPTTSYHYATVDLDLTALEAGYDYGSFIEISFDSASSTTFISAYLDSYSPTNLLTNWLGDAGTSGNYFGPDAIAFDVTAPVGHHLLLVMNETVTNGGLNMLGNYAVNAYSDTLYSDLAVAAPVPEPATWGLMAGGIALVAVARRRRAASPAAALVASN